MSRTVPAIVPRSSAPNPSVEAYLSHTSRSFAGGEPISAGAGGRPGGGDADGTGNRIL